MITLRCTFTLTPKIIPSRKNKMRYIFNNIKIRKIINIHERKYYYPSIKIPLLIKFNFDNRKREREKEEREYIISISFLQ